MPRYQTLKLGLCRSEAIGQKSEPLHLMNNSATMAPVDTSVKMADGRQGPHPSYIEVAKPFIFETKIHQCLTASGLAESRDDKIRLEGISWIDNVRKALHLCVSYPLIQTSSG